MDVHTILRKLHIYTQRPGLEHFAAIAMRERLLLLRALRARARHRAVHATPLHDAVPPRRCHGGLYAASRGARLIAQRNECDGLAGVEEDVL